MQIKDWKYYNHAAIPTTAPHEPVDIESVKNGSIWKIGGYCAISSMDIRLGLWT